MTGDQADTFLEANTWDADARRWVPRPAGAPVVLTAPSTTTPADLFSRAYRDEERRELAALLEAGMHRDEAAAERWRARADEGWTPGEIAGVLGPLVDVRLLRELAVRFEGLQEWGAIAPPRRPQPGARRLLDGCAWQGETWAPATEGERWPVPPSWQWLRLRCTPETRPDKPPTRAHKAFNWTDAGWDKGAETPGGRFVPELVDVADDVEAWAEFFEAQALDRGAFMVRGVLARNPDHRGQTRRAKLDDKGAWIGEHPIGRRVMLLDVDDKLPVAEVWPDWPGFERVPTEAELAELVRRTLRWALPEAFHNAACAVAFSASAGVPGGGRGTTGWGELRVHVVIVCDRPFNDASFRAWINERVRRVDVTNKAGKVESKPVVDTAPADPIQFMYLADPTFEGAPSPWPAHLPRVMLLAGVREIETPAECVDGVTWRRRQEAIAAQEAIEAAARVLEAELADALRRDVAALRPRLSSLAERLQASIRDEGESDEDFINRRVARWCERELETFTATLTASRHHDTLNKATFRLWRGVAPGLIDEADAERAVLEAWGETSERKGTDSATWIKEAKRTIADAKRDVTPTTREQLIAYFARQDESKGAGT